MTLASLKSMGSDFKGFCSAKIAKEKPTIKEIFVADVIEHKEFLEIVFIGDGFFHEPRCTS